MESNIENTSNHNQQKIWDESSHDAIFDIQTKVSRVINFWSITELIKQIVKNLDNSTAAANEIEFLKEAREIQCANDIDCEKVA